MGKFKLGDKVRLKKDLPMQIYNGIKLVHQIKSLINKSDFVPIIVVDDDDDTVKVRTTRGDYWIGEDALELYQEQPHIYKVGDKVRIKEREGNSSGYPFTFLDCMNELAGTICKIKEIKSIAVESFLNPQSKYINDDYHIYTIMPIDSSDRRDFVWAWHSSMFEPVEEDVPITESDNKISTTQKIQNNEIRFQKPKASCKRGTVPTGSTISGRKDKIAISIGHLSYQVCNC